MVTISRIKSIDELIHRLWNETEYPIGVWMGRGAEALELSGGVEKTQLRNLLRGLSPDGRPTFAHSVDAPDVPPGLEIALNAPKSVSALWALASERQANEIQACAQGAAETASVHAERALYWDATGLLGQRKAAVFAVIHEQVSQDQNPNLHSHVVACNFDGRMDEMNDGTIARVRHHVDFVYQRQLRHRLEQNLGIVTESEENGFRVRGMPRNISNLFSQSGQLTLGLPHELFQSWRDMAEKAGWGEKEAGKLLELRNEQKQFTEKFDFKRRQAAVAHILSRRFSQLDDSHDHDDVSPKSDSRTQSQGHTY